MDANTEGLMDGKPMELVCTTCDAVLHTTVGEARRATSLQCPNGHPIEFDAAQLDKSIRRSEQNIANILSRMTFEA